MNTKNEFLKSKSNSTEELKNSAESKGLENIDKALKDGAARLNQLGIPVDNECRLQIEKYTNYPKEKIFQDKIREDRFKERFDYENRNKSLGEQFERLKTAFLQKHLSEDFIICRTTFFDDVFNGIDNIILDKKTGNIVCALDEVCDIHSKRYEEKRQKVLDVNRMGGVKIEYGFQFNPENKKIDLTPIKNIPLFFLGLNEKSVKDCIKQFGSNNFQFDQGILTYFIQSLKYQADLLNNVCPKNSEVSKRISDFQKVLTEIINRYNLQPNKK